jgi:hypothetical protein
VRHSKGEIPPTVFIKVLGTDGVRAFEGSPLFQCTDTSENKRSYSVSLHLAQFTGLLGSKDEIPPTVFIKVLGTDGVRLYEIRWWWSQQPSITGLLGPPPPDLIEPDTISAEYFDKDGRWDFILTSLCPPLQDVSPTLQNWSS